MSLKEKETKTESKDTNHDADINNIIQDTYLSNIIPPVTKLFLFIFSFLMTFLIVFFIAKIQVDDYNEYIQSNMTLLSSNSTFCQDLYLANINLVSSITVFPLIILYIIIYKRRIFLVKKFKYRNIGLPMIVSCWNKSDRLFTCLTYGIIAYNVYKIIRDSLGSRESLYTLIGVKDPSGLLRLFLKIVEVLIIGLRYYPVLVAFRTKTFLINLFSSIHIWIDYGLNFIDVAVCSSFVLEINSVNDKSELERRLGFFVAYKVLSTIPLCLFTTLVGVTLVYRTIDSLIILVKGTRSMQLRKKMIEDSKDTCLCSYCNIEDDNEVIFSISDLRYVIDLLKTPDTQESSNIEKQILNKEEIKNMGNSYFKVKVKNESKLEVFIRKYIYDWNPDFQFTSRFVNTIFVANIALYYFFLSWFYEFGMFITFIAPSFTSDFVNLENSSINIGFLIDIPNLEIQMPEQFVKFLPQFRISSILLILLPLFFVMVICLLQMFFFIKESKKFIIELYKGNCEFIKKVTSKNNRTIFGNSFHFGGYVVGYLIFGYVLIYTIAVIIGAIIMGIRMFGGDELFYKIFLFAIPPITVLIVTQLINIFITKRVFIILDSKILAIDNFRAFNIYLYFYFYYDVFMGFLSSIIRLLKALAANVLMMPMHSNPTLISFCSILYYNHLAEYIKIYLIEKKKIEAKSKGVTVQLKQFDGRPFKKNIKNESKNYCKIIVNRWHLLVKLDKNKVLLRYRKKENNFNLEKIYRIRKSNTSTTTENTDSYLQF